MKSLFVRLCSSRKLCDRMSGSGHDARRVVVVGGTNALVIEGFRPIHLLH